MSNILARRHLALPLSAAAAAILAVSGCHAGSSDAAATPAHTSQTPAPASSGQTSTTPASTASAASNTDACSLITEQEAGTALGADPGAGQEVTPGHCIYGAGSSSINVVLQPGGEAAFEQLRGAMASRAVDVPGVGDAAFGLFAGPMATIEFYVGDTLVALNLNIDGAPAPPKDQATTLATTAATRV